MAENITINFAGHRSTLRHTVPQLHAGNGRLTGSEIGLRAWMQASNPELEEETPLALLLNGEGEVVAELLGDVLLGEPA